MSDERDELDPARGIITGALIGALIWFAGFMIFAEWTGLLR